MRRVEEAREGTAVSVGEVEPVRGLVEEQGGFLRNLRRAGASLGRGRITAHARRMVRFCLVGVSGVLVNTAILYALTEIGGLNHLVAAAFATEAAIINNFLLNDRWTFGDARSANPRLKRSLRYNSVALVGLVISVGVLAALTYLLQMHYLLANLFAIGAGTLWNYTGSSLFAWVAPASPGGPVAGRPGTSRSATPGKIGWGRRMLATLAGVVRPWT